MATSLRKSARVASLVVAVALTAGCGGGGRGGSHTYVITPSGAQAGVSERGIYITIISPVAFPQSFLNHASKRVKFVHHATGPRVCSYKKTVQGLQGQYANLDGKSLTLQVNGSNPLVVQFCAAFKNSSFNPGTFG